MADYRLQEIHDPDKNYRIRGCMLVAQVPTPVPGSIKVECAECDRPIWMNPNQKIPDMPEGTANDGDINLCIDCLRFHIAIDQGEPQWIGPKPPGFD